MLNISTMAKVCMARVWITLLLVAQSVFSYADSADLRLSQQAASLTYKQNKDGLSAGGTYLSYGLRFNDKDDIVIDAAFVSLDEASSKLTPFQIGVGAKAYYGRYQRLDYDFSAIAIGGLFRYTIPSWLFPMTAAASLYYAPEITSFGDGESVLEIDISYEVEVVSSTQVYMGYRLLNVGFEQGSDAKIEDSVGFGIQLQF